MNQPNVGEEERLRVIASRVRAIARRYARGGGPLGADDLEQEGLLAALEAIRGWAGGPNCEGLLLQRAHWRMQDALRKWSKRECLQLVDCDQFTVPSHEPEVCERLSVEQSIVGLPKVQQIAIRARYFSDEPVWITANKLGLPRTTLSGALRRALRRMRDDAVDNSEDF
jgi:RNA polymerase sigma factor (sigma-70 family)